MVSCKKYIALLAFLITGCYLYAQKFTASAGRSRVTMGEVVEVKFELTNPGGRNFTPPSFSDFTIYSGPVQTSFTQIMNGTVSQSTIITYLLIPKKEGMLTIGPATIVVGGNTLSSNSLTLEVVKATSHGQAQGAPSDQQKVQTGNSNLFARTTVSKSKVFAGEQIVITHKVYTRLNLKGFQEIKFPSYNGFWTQEVARQSQYEVSQESVDGVPYSVVEIKRAFLFPQRSGKVEIGPMEVQCVVREKTGKRHDPFEQIFGHDPFFSFDSFKDVLYKINSNPVYIEVSPLPEAGTPADFPGAVGNFSMNASIDKEKVKANEGINLKITVSGKGNLKLIDSPKLQFPDEFESYDPKTSENIAVNESGVNGSKTFEYLLIPRHEGIYKIPSWNFHYFDTDKKSYVSFPAKEFTITVEKGDGAALSSGPMVSSVAREDVKMIGSDIRYIKTGNINLIRKEETFWGSPGFIFGFTAPPLLFLAFLFLRREHIRRNSNLVMVKRRRAGGVARKHLTQAERSLKNNDKETFFVNILSALYNYVEHKMNIPVSEHSKEKVVQVLKEKSIPEETIAELVRLLDECEFARYAPGLQSGSLEDVYGRAESIINKIEDSGI